MLTVTVSRRRTWRRARSRLMGCPVEILVDGPERCVANAFDRLHELERTWSRFVPDSELNRVHALAGEWIAVSADLFAAFDRSLRMHVETGGLFDPTIRAALEAWGYDRTFREVDAADRPVPASRPARGFAAIELDRTSRAVRLAPGLAIDLGGIGKGLAAEIVAEEAVTGGASGVYVCLGGDIHAAGEPRGRGWHVPLLHPRTRSPFAHHVLQTGGLVMSTSAIRRWTCGGVAAHHLIDPRTGAPSTGDVVAVAVAAQSSARAEALAKAALIAGCEHGTDLLQRSCVRAWVLTVDDAVVEVEP